MMFTEKIQNRLLSLMAAIEEEDGVLVKIEYKDMRDQKPVKQATVFGVEVWEIK